MFEEKYEELTRYLMSLAARLQVDPSHREDVVSTTITVLWEEHTVNPFPTPRALFGRATNVMRDEARLSFAASLPVSGVGRQAHHYARKYLAANGFDPHAAYANQTETPRVSLELLKIVAGGTGQTDPSLLEGSQAFLSGPVQSSLSEDTEDALHDAVSRLPEPAQTVVRKYMGLGYTPKPLSDVASELGITQAKAKALWRAAKKDLRESLG